MEIVKYYNIDTLVNLSTIKFSASQDDTSYITYSNLTSQQGTPDIPWNSICSIASVNQIYTHGKFYFPGKSGYTGSVYGVQWNTKDPSPECTRIGNMSLHATLPVQSQMVGGTMTDEGVFTEFSNQSDWTSETRDGSIGQVMVRIPRFWWKFETIGDFNRVLMSAIPVIGFKMVPEQYVSAYEASLQRSTNKLSSVVNSDPDYRGGNNQSAWDNEDTAGYNGESHRSLLGRPATSISLTNFRTYARNRKPNSTEWNCNTYEIQRALYWLYVVEYATLNSQKAYNSSLDSNGFHQGGLGDGVTNWSTSSWDSYNSQYPFVPCGWTDEYGNITAIKNYIVYDSSGTALVTVSVPRYRGIENPFGHIWKWTDGILINVQSNASVGQSPIYVTTNPSKFSSTSFDNYDFIGNQARSSNYIKTIIFGENGDIIATEVQSSSTSYYCDRNYANIPSSGTSLRGLRFGGGTDNGAISGFVCSSSNRVPSLTNVNVGTRLTYLPSDDTIISVAKFKSVVPNTATSIIFGKLEDYDVTGWTLLDYIGSRAQIAVFNQGTEYLVLNIKNKTIYAPSTCNGMFNNYSSLVTLEFNNFNTQNVTDMQFMFQNCSSLTSLDLSSFNTTKVRYMSYMFFSCSNLISLDLSNFNTANVTLFLFMFYFCGKLTNLSAIFDLTKAQNLNAFMLEIAAPVIYLKGNAAQCSNFNNAFESAKIVTIYAKSFNIKSGATSDSMFKNCSRLVGGAGTTYNSSHITAEYARVDGENDLPGYFTAPQVN